MNGLTMTPCPGCGYVPEEWTLAEDLKRREAPGKGALMVCIACGALQLVDEGSIGLYLRELTPQEHQTALADPRVMKVLAARAIVARRRGDKGMRE